MAKDKVTAHKSIHARFFVIGDKRAMLDFDLAEIYGIEVKALNQAVSRDKERFPNDFIFRITPEIGQACGHKL